VTTTNRSIALLPLRKALEIAAAVVVAASVGCQHDAITIGPPDSPARAARVVFAIQPTNTIAGVAIAPALTVAIQDASGNVLTSATDAVTIAVATGPGALLGKTTTNAVNGVATFQDLSIETAGSQYSLVAVATVSPALTSAPSNRFSVTPAPASKLIVGASELVEAAKQFAVGARVSDAFGNTQPGVATSSVTLSMSSNPGGATLAGTLTVPVVGGLASFTNLTLDRPGAGYVLQATAGELTGTMKLDVWGAGAFSVVSAGGAHTCATTHSGTLYCWGANSSGQVGVGTVIDYARPVLVAASANSVSAGGSHSCAIVAGVLYCWGLNDDGQLGDGSKTARSRPTAASVSSWPVGSVIAGGSHTCGGFNDDPWDYGESTTCWGNNAQGQLGALANTSMFALVAGGAHTCGTDYGPSHTLYCWGSNANGQLGVVTSIQSSATPHWVGPLSENGALTAGRAHTCASLTIESNSGLFCWGLNDDGQLGDGTTTQRTIPVLVRGGPFSSATAGGAHTCALTSAGRAYCWGANDHGQLGDGTTTKRTSPVLVAGGLSFMSLSAGGSHTCGVTVGGLYCWGANGRGQLGNGTISDSAMPVRVGGQ
jgi:alpha-tubulin suppressor-like RCC1 family protein